MVKSQWKQNRNWNGNRKNAFLKSMKTKIETEHNGDWKKIHALKPIKARTEAEHNADWKKCMVKSQWKQNRNWT